MKRLLIAGAIVLLLVGGTGWYLVGRGPADQDFVNFVFSLPRDTANRLMRPLAVATHEKKVYIVDSAGKEVQVFDRSGRFQFRFALPVTEAPDAYPVGIAIDDDGQVYLSDLQKGQLLRFSSDGQFESVFHGAKESLTKPLALAYADGKVYVTDVGDHGVKVFDGAGKLVRRFGSPGDGKGEFAYPNGVAVAGDGSVFVSDSNNHRVQVFDEKGEFKYSFGRKVLTLPRGIAIDQFDRVYVADTFGLKVMIFEPEGKFIGAFPRASDDQAKERLLQGISVETSARRIYVTDRLNRTVSVWKY